MPSASNSSWQTFFSALLSLVIASGLWYLVVGRDHVETQVELRVEYRGLPSGLVVDEGLVNNLSVRLRGSAELLRNLHSRDLVYTVDLSGLKRGANALPLEVGQMPDLKPFEIIDTTPSRLVLEADALTERVVPLADRMIPLPVNSPYTMSQVLMEPSFVTVKGPEMRLSALERLLVVYDPNKNTREGAHEANVAIVAPPQLEVTPPVTTLRYTLELKTKEVELERKVQIDGQDGDYAVSPASVQVKLSVPEGLIHDIDYLDAVRIAVRPPADLANGMEADLTPLVMLPSGARLGTITPSTVHVVRVEPKEAPSPQWSPAESPFSMPVNFFGMGLSQQRVTRDFSLDDVELPAAAMPQPDDLKVQPVIPSEAAQEKPISARTAPDGGKASVKVQAPTLAPVPSAPAVHDLATNPLPQNENSQQGRK